MLTSGNKLQWFKGDTSAKARGEIDLAGAKVVAGGSVRDFTITPTDTFARNYVVRAHTDDEGRAWLADLQKAAAATK